MAKFIKSKFRLLWGTVFSFFAGIFSSDVLSQEADGSDDTGTSVEEASKDEALDPGAIAAAVAAAAALIAANGDNAAPSPAHAAPKRRKSVMRPDGTWVEISMPS